MVPGIGPDRELHTLLHPLVIGADLQDAAVPVQGDQVTLVYQTDGRHHPAVAVGRNIRFQHIVAELGIAEEVHRALEKHVVEPVGNHLAAVMLEHVPLDAGSKPGERRKVHGFPGIVFHGEGGALEISAIPDGSDHTAACGSSHPVHTGLEGPG